MENLQTSCQGVPSIECDVETAQPGRSAVRSPGSRQYNYVLGFQTLVAAYDVAFLTKI